MLFPCLASFFSPPSAAQQNFSFATQYTLANADDSTHLGTFIAVPAPDGGYYLGGLYGYLDQLRPVTIYRFKYILFKTDCAGHITWNLSFDSTFFPLSTDFEPLIQIIPTSNYTLFLRNYKHPGVVAIDQNNNILLQKELFFSSPDSSAYISSIHKLPNGNWVFCGNVPAKEKENYVPEHIFFLSTDNNFNLQWSYTIKLIGNFSRLHSSSILFDSNNIYFVGSYFKTTFFILKTDYNGNIIFYKDYIFHPNSVYLKINQPALLINNAIYTIAHHHSGQVADYITNLILVRIDPTDGHIENAKYLELPPKKNLEQDFRNPIRMEYDNGKIILQTTVFYEGYNLPFRAVVDTNFNLLKVERWTLPNDYSFFHSNPLGFFPHLHDSNSYSSLQRNFFPFSFRRGGLFVSKRPLNDLHCFHYNNVTDQYRITEPPTTNASNPGPASATTAIPPSPSPSKPPPSASSRDSQPNSTPTPPTTSASTTPSVSSHTPPSNSTPSNGSSTTPSSPPITPSPSSPPTPAHTPSTSSPPTVASPTPPAPYPSASPLPTPHTTPPTSAPATPSISSTSPSPNPAPTTPPSPHTPATHPSSSKSIRSPLTTPPSTPPTAPAKPSSSTVPTSPPTPPSPSPSQLPTDATASSRTTSPTIPTATTAPSHCHSPSPLTATNSTTTSNYSTPATCPSPPSNSASTTVGASSSSKPTTPTPLGTATTDPSPPHKASTSPSSPLPYPTAIPASFGRT